jgi:hypothetical protein
MLSFFLWCLLELLSSKMGWSKKICIRTPSFNVESWRPNANFFVSISLQLSSLELESFKRGRDNFSCLNRALKKTKKLHTKMKKLERAIGKAWKQTSSCCCVCMSSTSYKNKNIRIYRVSIKILGFPTHLFQISKLKSVI